MSQVVTFRLSVPPISGVLRPRLILVCLAVAAAAFLAFCLGIGLGEVPLGLGEVVGSLLGTGDQGTAFVVRELRLPRALTGLLAGIAFGLSGALFQTMTRNPLASPDMIGVTQGAGVAVVAGIALGLGVGLQVLGFAGAVFAALITYLLAWRRGGATGNRIVLVGIGLSWICTSATEYLMVTSGDFQAQQALGWLFGNLNGRTWDHVMPLAIALAVLAPAALLLARWSQVLQLGDELAVVLGAPVQLARLTLLMTGVALVAFGTAAAGPVAFVALSAPQIARRLAGTAWPPPLASGLAGAFIVLGADLIARLLIPDVELPVGVVTGALGAPILLWLLARTRRR
ncbi:FecCD family ABC transporter permease [Nonomuraea basaltis]|uniref:FecCD family ABC transporter permease n=1 Tax=Nonomuraea basaltis TaxID=2495887 RepID=UPI00110C680A|nr:iron ABC transporter permease [Nonomuraea basaltis]TMR94530.1 iron ABC transporter permease [Nonomuraea basaltis]